jgi:hypothetical protein
MSASTDNTNGIVWRPADLDAAQFEAASTGKLILVDFFSPT